MDNLKTTNGFTEEDIQELENEKCPLLVTRGPHHYTPPQKTTQQETIIDWLNFTCEEPHEILQEFFKLLFPNEELVFIRQNKGQHFYREQIQVTLKSFVIAFINFNQKGTLRNFVSMSGKQCKYIKDWDYFHFLLSKLTKPTITRIDLSLDFFNKEVTFEKVKEAYDQGKFKLPKSPINPQHLIIAGQNGQGGNKGRTFQVGKPGGRKYLRAYEKGYEQFGSMIKEDQDFYFEYFDYFINGKISYKEQSLTGSQFRDWFRVEIEFTNDGIEIPISTILDRDSYYSGAYPFTKEILPNNTQGVTMQRKPKLPKDNDIRLLKKLDAMRNQYGKTIADLMLYSGRTKEEIIDYLFFKEDFWKRQHNGQDIKIPLIKLEYSQDAIKNGILLDKE